MFFFNDHVFHKTGAHVVPEIPHATAKPPCVVHPLNVPATPGEAPQDFMDYRLECLTIKTISVQGSDGILIRRPALVVQMIMENADDFGDGATYSLRTLASIEDLRLFNHPQAEDARTKACDYYENKLPPMQQEKVKTRSKMALAAVAPHVEKQPLLTRLQRIWA